MTTPGRILIIDDSLAFLEEYEELLSAEGYVVETATTRTQALARLDEPGWDVVLVDQKLQGAGGPDTGLDLLEEVGKRTPGAKAILVTAYATDEAVQRAFQNGAYDYLEKKGVFGALLRVKVRNAMEAVRERRLSTLSAEALEQDIQQTWHDLEKEKDSHRKGRLLEQLMVLVFQSIPGLDRLDHQAKNKLEEIDILVQNNYSDPVWQKESPYLLVECKNWSQPVGDKELRDLWGKMDGRYNRCRLALLVAYGGFADTVRSLQLTKKEQDKLVLLLGPGDLDEIVHSKDRNEALKRLHRRSVVG